MIQQCSECGNEVDIPDDIERLVNALGQPICNGCFARWRQTHPAPPSQDVPVHQSKYAFTQAMGEMSGLGGGYEQTCRNMLAAGLEWLDAHPRADPQFHGYKGIYGIISEDNADGKALSEAIVAAANGDCTGAMHQAVISSCLWIRSHGWEAYCSAMTKEDGEGQS